MFRLILAALAAFFAVLYVFGDETRRPTPARAETEARTITASLASIVEMAGVIETAPVKVSEVSDAEAVRIALEAGALARGEASPLLGAAASVADVAVAPDADADIRYVTADRANLRAGPGTGNSVVGQVRRGEKVEVLEDREGWFRIRVPDQVATGWIFGEFLDESRPG